MKLNTFNYYSSARACHKETGVFYKNSLDLTILYLVSNINPLLLILIYLLMQRPKMHGAIQYFPRSPS
jgi:hypothetical protein